MAIPLYPSALPLPQLVQQFKDKERTLRTPMANGAVRARTLTTATETEHQLTFVFTQQEYDGFTGWFYHRLGGIETWFACDMIREKGTATETVRFIAEYTEQKQAGGMWLISGAVELKRTTRITADQTALAIYGEENINSWASALQVSQQIYKDIA